MACNNPFILIRDDPVLHALPVPCGKCCACRQDKLRMWQDRVSFESLTSKNGSSFLTLTFDDAHLPKNRSADVRHMQLFFKRLRKITSDKFKYVYASEYGEKTYRLHYHVCLINFDASALSVERVARAWADKDGNRLGIFTLDPLSPARIRYCLSYISLSNPLQNKIYKALGLSEPVHGFSKGIGSDWIEQHKDMIKKTNGYYSNGVLRPLPRYFADKLGMIEKNSYVKNLTSIWSKYNHILEARGLPVVDPFNISTLFENNYLDEISVSHNTVLSMSIGSWQKEKALAHKMLLKNQIK